MMTWIQNTVRDSARATARGRPEAPGILHRPSRASHRPAHTLVELIVSMFAASLLVAGMGSTLYVAGRALDDDSNVMKVRAAQVLGEVVQNLELALHFTERTSNAATFTVPDRDGDNLPETIRYAWSGIPSDPLTLEYNSSAPAVVAEDVHQFNLNALTRFVPARVLPPPDAGTRLLFVSGGSMVVQNPGDEALLLPTAQEALKIALIESWGYAVTPIHAAALQSEFDSAVANADVAYISEDITSSELGVKLTDAPIGVVNEEKVLIDEFGFSETAGDLNDMTISIADNPHYITETFNVGSLTILSAVSFLHTANGTYGGGVQALGKSEISPNDPVLLAIPSGGALYGGGSAAGRRVHLPWGNDDFDFNLLNIVGQTLMRRSIEWAAGAGDDGGPEEILLASHDDAPGGAFGDINISATDWAGNYFVPNLPNNTDSWSITRVQLSLNKVGNGDGVVAVQVRTADTNLEPTATVLEEVTLNESSLGNTPAWIEFPFSTLQGLDPADGLCIVVSYVSGSSTVAGVEYESGIPDEPNATWYQTIDSGTTWPAQSGEMRFFVYGKATPAP